MPDSMRDMQGGGSSHTRAEFRLDGRAVPSESAVIVHHVPGSMATERSNAARVEPDQRMPVRARSRRWATIDVKAIIEAVDSHLGAQARAERPQSVLLIADEPSLFADSLSSNGTDVVTHPQQRSDDATGWVGPDGEPVDHERFFGICVVDVEPEDSKTVADAVATAGAKLAPGGLLVLVDSLARNGSKRSGPWHAFRGRNGAPDTVDELTALLFREGFEYPRLHRRENVVAFSAHRSKLDPPTLRRQKLSVVMPVFNEKKTFAVAMDAVLGKEIPGIDIEIILVESNSTDGTREEALRYSEHPRVSLVLEDHPLGKGHAVRSGLREATGDFVLIQDADLEYSVDDYDALLLPLRSFSASFVLGVRRSPDGRWGMRHFGERSFVSRLMNVGHVMFLLLFNLVYGRWLHDPFTMYKVMRRDCLNGMVFECNRFDFDWELTGKLIRAGYRPREVPVSYHSRSFSEGKKVSFFGDPLTWVRACFKHRVSPLYEWD